jgi:hypothetical protein
LGYSAPGGITEGNFFQWTRIIDVADTTAGIRSLGRPLNNVIMVDDAAGAPYHRLRFDMAALTFTAITALADQALGQAIVTVGSQLRNSVQMKYHIAVNTTDFSLMIIKDCVLVQSILVDALGDEYTSNPLSISADGRYIAAYYDPVGAVPNRLRVFRGG